MCHLSFPPLLSYFLFGIPKTTTKGAWQLCMERKPVGLHLATPIAIGGTGTPGSSAVWLDNK
jgi:hypothetical protein